MKEWFSAAELTSLDLPDVPGTERAVQMMARRNNWSEVRNLAGAPLARKRKGRGGGWEYHYTVLPMAAQSRLVARETAHRVSAAGTKKSPNAKRANLTEAWAWYERQPERKKAKAEARLAALDAVLALKRGGLQVNIAVNEVARQQGVSASTIYAWQDLVAGLDRADWLPALAPQHTGRTRNVACDPAAWEFIKSDYLRASRPTFQSCFLRLQAAAEENGWSIPSSRTLQRRMEKEIPVAVQTLARKGVDALKQLYPAQERDRSGFHALEAVNADGHRWDVFVKWPGVEKPVRPMMLAVQDLYSGKILAWRHGLSESAHLVQLAFGDVFRDFGIPDYAWLDNGRGFASKWITGQQPNRFRFKVKDADPAGVLTQLGVEVHWTQPYSGQSKPIERAFRDLCDHAARHPAFEGAYTGNRPDAKPENYGSKAIPLERFEQIVDGQIAAHNARVGRRTQACAGQLSFDQAFEQSYVSAPIKKARPEHLTMCLMAAERVSARQPSGSVHLMGNRYWAEFLTGQIGRQLMVRFDPDDLYRGVEVYRLDGAHLGHAECWEAAGFADIEAARTHQHARKKYARAHKAMLEAERTLTPDQVAAMLPDLEPALTPDAQIVRPIFGNAVRKPDPVAAENPFDFEEAFASGMESMKDPLRLVEDD